MQTSQITTAIHRTEVDVAADLAAEAEALAQRVTSKIRQQTPVIPQPVVADEYEPQAVGDRRPSGRLIAR